MAAAFAMTTTSFVNDSITTSPLYLIALSALAMPSQQIWSLPGVPRSLPQAWTWPRSLPAFRMAFALAFLLDVHVKGIQVELERRTPNVFHHLERLIDRVDEVGFEPVQRSMQICLPFFSA